MNKTSILTIVFAIVALALAYYLFDSINSSIRQARVIKQGEKRIIDKLKLIREAEIAYQTVNGDFTSDWDKLIDFVKNGEFYLTERTEKIFELSYGQDSVIVDIDTLGTVSVADSLFNKRRYPDFDPEDLPYVPGVKPKTKFLIWADTQEKSGVTVDLIEVKNPKPINPTRNEENEYKSKKPLRFGSRDQVTTTGNWGE